MQRNISFLKKEDFRDLVSKTIDKYLENLEVYTLDDFLENKVDPIKLTFDQKIYNLTDKELISNEIQRQKDKSVNNSIGYFHQYLFSYIKNCVVPEHGFDVIYNDGNKKICVELKNKFNTMNSSSSESLYNKFQKHLKDHPNDYCYLVEVIASKSQNVVWLNQNNKIRRVSIDLFIEEITGDKLGFKKICDALPIVLNEVLKQKMPDKYSFAENVLDSISDEKEKDDTIIEFLFKKTFSTYEGYKK